MSEYQGKPKVELIKHLGEKRLALRSFRFAVAGSKTRNTKEGKNIRKDIARILTELRRDQ